LPSRFERLDLLLVATAVAGEGRLSTLRFVAVSRVMRLKRVELLLVGADVAQHAAAPPRRYARLVPLFVVHCLRCVERSVKRWRNHIAAWPKRDGSSVLVVPRSSCTVSALAAGSSSDCVMVVVCSQMADEKGYGAAASEAAAAGPKTSAVAAVTLPVVCLVCCASCATRC